MTKTTPRLHPLQALRIARDWSYAELAAHIHAVTGVERSLTAWRKICQGESIARVTTQAAINRFLEAQPRQAVSR